MNEAGKKIAIDLVQKSLQRAFRVKNMIEA